ncbi:MAG TPA: histidine kinase dimerization/phospho-acceptor domain-containing protein [Candidatus Binatia bacterium]|nr:histidine kinase dimerization/phospho-acceptor domain-containing protein [Candidatus Binatia bacterium]
MALPPLPAGRAEALLAPPWIPPAALDGARLARAAARFGVPVRLAVPAALQLPLARALHTAAGRGGRLTVLVGRRPSLAGLAPEGSLYLDAGSLAPEAALALAAACDDGAPWVLAGVEPGGAPPPPLLSRLTAIALEVPPLARRGAEEIGALADAILERLAARGGRATPALAPAATARLIAHGWPGDVPELEAVLARALLVAPEDGPIAAEHLVLTAAGEATAADTRAGGAPPAQLEALLTELAHELRNPLVTVKTFAEHLPELLDDAELRARFATLTREAIARMDGLLENVLGFARLACPTRGAVELGPILDGVLADVAPELEGRAVQVRRTGTTAARCATDPTYVAYALRNLFAGIAREVPPREEVALDTSANGIVRVRFRAGGADLGRLRRLLGGTPVGEALGDPTLLPLAFTLARAALARAGGGLELVPEVGGATTVVVRLPLAETRGD